MPPLLNYFDLYRVYATLVVQVRPHVGAVPAREFGVELNVVRANFLDPGILNLVVDVQPTSDLTDEQLRGLVFLLRDARQRGGICIFSGGAADLPPMLARFGLTQPTDWFPTQAHALAAIHAASMPAMTAPFIAPPPMMPHMVPPPMMQPPPAAPAPVARPRVPSPTPAPPRPAPPAETANQWTPPPRGRFFPAHELTLRAHHRQPILESEQVCAHLAERIRAESDRCNFAVWAFVFMPDHFHLLVQSRQLNYDVIAFLDSIKQSFEERAIEILSDQSPQVLNRLRSKQGGRVAYDFWQRTSGQNRHIDFTRPLRPLINHMHENPVRRGLVSNPLEWTWSSAGAYAGRPHAQLQPDTVPPELLGE